jgi:hypothetical protein
MAPKPRRKREKPTKIVDIPMDLHDIMDTPRPVYVGDDGIPRYMDGTPTGGKLVNEDGKPGEPPFTEPSY